MGRAITTSAIMVSILLLCFWGIWYTHETQATLSASIDTAIASASAQKQQELSQAIDQLDIQWKKREVILSLFVRHEELEAVESLIVRLKAQVSVQAYDSILVELDYLNHLLSRIHEHEMPSLNTVF